MSKELENNYLILSVDYNKEKDCRCAILDLVYNDIHHIIYETIDKEQIIALDKVFREYQKMYQRLEAIDNANPSEALDCLESMSNEEALFRSILSKSTVYMGGERIDDFSYKSTIGNMFKGAIPIIKQALLKAQEQEKVLEIIKEKNVDILLIKNKDNVNQYNEYIEDEDDRLTEEEFDLVKRWVG